MLKFRVYTRKMAHEEFRLEDFAEGVRRHGHEAVIVPTTAYEKADLSVFWGVNHPGLIEKIREDNKDYVVLERGYVGDRNYWTSVGFNGLNGRANFNNKNSSSDRWNRYFGHDYIQPWNPHGEYALIMGQVRGDQSIRHVDIEAWYRSTVNELKEKYPGTKICYRRHPHPAMGSHNILGAETIETPFEIALVQASLVVTFNSNSGVDAVLRGKPCVACDRGSMAWPVTTHSVAEDPITPLRAQWLWDLAYCQWSPEEIRNGECWENLSLW